MKKKMLKDASNRQQRTHSVTDRVYIGTPVDARRPDISRDCIVFPFADHQTSNMHDAGPLYASWTRTARC